MTPNDQLILLNTLLGEPSDSSDPNARWTPDQKIAFINLGRERVCEEARCFQVKDSQQTNPGGVPTAIYSLSNDFISFYAVEWNGVRLHVVRQQDWRDVIGEDDTLIGTPEICMYFARQLQLFLVPNKAGTLLYHGWAYASAIQANGVDPDFTDQMAKASVYAAASEALASDDRENSKREEEAVRRIGQLFRQYRPKGPRFVRDQALPRFRRVVGN